MFAGKTILQIMSLGGFSLWILLICSIISIAVIIERAIYFYKREKVKRVLFMTRMRDDLKDLSKENLTGAIKSCELIPSLYSDIAKAGLDKFGESDEKIKNAMEREVTHQISFFERRLNILGTIGSVAVYIGLFGTVIGIIKIFHDISAVRGGGIDQIIAGISEALICTAAGICVAVPAVVAYNVFVKWLERITTDMDLSASEMSDLLKR